MSDVAISTIFIAVFIIVTILVGYIKLNRSEDNPKKIVASVKKFVVNATNLTPCKRDLKGKIKKSNALFVHPIEDGPLWDENDLLVVDKSCIECVRDSYYLIRLNEDCYRITKCVKCDDILLPVFEDNETFEGCETVGKIIGVWRFSKNKYEWF